MKFYISTKEIKRVPISNSGAAGKGSPTKATATRRISSRWCWAWDRSAVSPYESCVLGKYQLRGIRIIIHLLWCGYLEAWKQLKSASSPAANGVQLVLGWSNGADFFQMGLKGFCLFKWTSDPFGLAAIFSFKQGMTATSF
jgi:hypothetical protein